MRQKAGISIEAVIQRVLRRTLNIDAEDHIRVLPDDTLEPVYYNLNKIWHLCKDYNIKIPCLFNIYCSLFCACVGVFFFRSSRSTAGSMIRRRLKFKVESFLEKNGQIVHLMQSFRRLD